MQAYVSNLNLLRMYLVSDCTTELMEVDCAVVAEVTCVERVLEVEVDTAKVDCVCFDSMSIF